MADFPHTPLPWAKEYIGESPDKQTSDRPTVFYIGDYRIVVDNARGYDRHEEDEQDADFVLAACHAYEASQEQIRQLKAENRVLEQYRADFKVLQRRIIGETGLSAIEVVDRLLALDAMVKGGEA